MTPVIFPWIVEIGIITWRSLTGEHWAGVKTPKAGQPLHQTVTNINKSGVKRPPLPSELLATFLVFGTCAAIAEKSARTGQLIAWGFVLATGLIFLGGTPTAIIPQANPTTFPPGQYNPGFLPNPTGAGPNYPPQGGR